MDKSRKSVNVLRCHQQRESGIEEREKEKGGLSLDLITVRNSRKFYSFKMRRNRQFCVGEREYEFN